MARKWSVFGVQVWDLERRLWITSYRLTYCSYWISHKIHFCQNQFAVVLGIFKPKFSFAFEPKNPGKPNLGPAGDLNFPPPRLELVAFVVPSVQNAVSWERRMVGSWRIRKKSFWIEVIWRFLCLLTTKMRCHLWCHFFLTNNGEELDVWCQRWIWIHTVQDGGAENFQLLRLNEIGGFIVPWGCWKERSVLKIDILMSSSHATYVLAADPMVR